MVGDAAELTSFHYCFAFDDSFMNRRFLLSKLVLNSHLRSLPPKISHMCYRIVGIFMVTVLKR